MSHPNPKTIRSESDRMKSSDRVGSADRIAGGACRSGLKSVLSLAQMDPPVGPMDVYPESQEKETPVTTKSPGMGAGSEPSLPPFPCPYCPKTYILQRSLNDHMKVHSPDNPHVCPLCNKAFVDDYQLAAHIRIHTGEKLFKCTAVGCGKEFTRRHNLEFHMRTHHGKKMEPKPICVICEKSFANTEGLRIHNWEVHKPEECQYCGKRFAWKTYLRKHIRTHTGEKSYKCDKCGKGFVDSTTLKKHRSAIHPEEKREEDWQTPTHTQVDGQDPLYIPSENKQGLGDNCSTKSDLQVGPTDSNPESQEIETPVALQPLEIGEPKSFPCTHCPKTFRLKESLNDHIKVHSPDNPHVCPLCDKEWADSYKLTRHMRSHTGEKLFKCSADGCGKEFAQRNTLESHMRIHTGESSEPKPTCAICGTSFTHVYSLKLHNWKFHNPQAKQHPCGTCGKVFISLAELKRHMETHLLGDPQECPICGESCRNGLVLKKHVQRHSLQETYQCEHCLKNFKAHRYLKKHIRTIHGGMDYTREKPFKCTTCSKVLATREGLESHSKLHTGENLKECQFCGRKFTLLSNLSQHIRTHNGETPYKCDECGMAFRWSSSLERHMTAAHLGEQQKMMQDTFHQHTAGIAQMDPMTDTPSKNKNTKNNDPLTEVLESSSQVYLDKGFDLRELSIPIPRMRSKDAGVGVLELRSGGGCWYVCGKCGRGSKSVLIRSHALRCEVHQSNNPIIESGQTIG